MRRFVGLLLAAAISLMLAVTVSAAPGEAEELAVTAACMGVETGLFTDGGEATYQAVPDGGAVTVTSESPIHALYVLFDRIYGPWSLSDGKTTVPCGEQNFLHEYVDVAGAFGYAPEALTMTFSHGECALSEIHAFGAGEVPAWVQRWQTPCRRADLLLMSTHSDDEHLFFAGLLPYYAGERGLDTQVVYFTSPFSYHDRPHEQLNGLWAVGVRHYPVWGPFVDAYSESAQEAYQDQAPYGYSREDMVRFQARMIRRFRPFVIVGHDRNGEYGHGQHIINCETLTQALELAADSAYDSDSARQFGVWNTPKTYLHLWEQNRVAMDWDTPLARFGGKTAFQVSQEGFLCHESQQWTWFHRWMFGENGEIVRASQIETYSPCLYGLYRTTVGPDTTGGDLFEHIF